MAYLHRDQLNSVRAITDPDGNLQEQRVYDPFGTQHEDLEAEALTAPIETKGWIGERFDSDAGLQYLNARYYDPELAMFIQPDWWEVTNPGVGTNRYAYSANDPINLMDPGGNGSAIASPLPPDYRDPLGLDNMLGVGGGVGGGTAVGIGLGELIGAIIDSMHGEDSVHSEGSGAEALPQPNVRVGELAPPAPGRVPLYRAVGPGEAASLVANGGVFTPSPYGSEGKYFALDPAGAAIEGRALHSGGFVVVATTAPEKILSNGSYFEDATREGRVPSIVVWNPELPLLSPAVPIILD